MEQWWGKDEREEMIEGYEGGLKFGISSTSNIVRQGKTATEGN